MKKLILTSTKEIIDQTTGEVKSYESQKVFSEKITPGKFFFAFIGHMVPFYKVTNSVPVKILVWMCERAQFNTGKVLLTADERDELCKYLDISQSQLTHGLKKLKDEGLIEGERGRGTFLINPEIFWKGELSERKQILENKELQISFELVDKNDTERQN